jgi:hypothetical protein
VEGSSVYEKLFWGFLHGEKVWNHWGIAQTLKAFVSLELNQFFCFKNVQQDSHCTFNAIMRRFGVTIVAVQKQYVLHILNLCL